MSDILERLRDLVVDVPRYGKGVRASITADDLEEAAAEIERLRNEADQLRERFGKLWETTYGGARLEEIARAFYEHPVWGHKQPWEKNPWAREAWVQAVKDTRDKALALADKAICEREAAEARLAEAVEVVREFHDAAQIDAVMEGPRLTGWNRSALNRAWPKATAFLAKLEGRS